MGILRAFEKQRGGYLKNIWENFPRKSYVFVGMKYVSKSTAELQNTVKVLMFNSLHAIGFLDQEKKIDFWELGLVIFHAGDGTRGIFLTEKSTLKEDCANMPQDILDGSSPYVGIVQDETQITFYRGSNASDPVMKPQRDISQEEAGFLNQMVLLTYLVEPEDIVQTTTE